MQLAIVLHPKSMANENFLFSLRNCLGGLPQTHTLAKWFKNEKKVNSSVHELLQMKSQNVWSHNHAITPGDKRKLQQFILSLDTQSSYLDVFLLNAAGHVKMGNTARARALIQRFINYSFLDLYEGAPARFDTLISQELLPILFETISKGLKEDFLSELLWMYLLEFYNQKELVSLSEERIKSSMNDSLKKFNLHYYREKTPVFSLYLRNKYFLETRYHDFLLGQWNDKSLPHNLWVFFARMPEERTSRMRLEKKIIEIKETSPEMYFLLTNDESFRFKVLKDSSSSLGQWTKEKRKYFLDRFKRNKKDTIALFELIKLGSIDDETIEQVAEINE